LGRGTPRQGAQAGQQFVKREGFDQVVVGSTIQPAHPIGHRVARGQDQDRSVHSALAQGPADLDSILPRQQEVEDDRVVAERRRQLLTLQAVVGAVNRVAFLAQAQPSRAVP